MSIGTTRNLVGDQNRENYLFREALFHHLLYDYSTMTIVILSEEENMKTTEKVVSKAHFKPHALAYLRQVQQDKKPLTITHDGKPVVRIIPIETGEIVDPVRQKLRGSVLHFEKPNKPVGLKDWSMLP